MNRAELAARVAARTSMSKAGVDAAVNAVFSTIAVALASGETVTIVGFGTGSERVRNLLNEIATGAPVPQPAHRRAHRHRRLNDAFLQGRQGPSRRPRLAKSGTPHSAPERYSPSRATLMQS